MWPRVVELMLGVWLALSPFILGAESLGRPELVNTFVCALLVITASCLSYWEPTRSARVLTAIVGFWLAGGAYVSASHPASPPVQNAFLVGLLLILFTIVPNDAALPSRSWRVYAALRRK